MPFLILISTTTDTQNPQYPFPIRDAESKTSLYFHRISKWIFDSSLVHALSTVFSRSIIDSDVTLLPTRHRALPSIRFSFRRRGKRPGQSVGHWTATWKEISRKRHNMDFTADSTKHNTRLDPDVLTFVRSLTIVVSFSPFCLSNSTGRSLLRILESFCLFTIASQILREDEPLPLCSSRKNTPCYALIRRRLCMIPP